jgi:hypothetical protein
MTAWAARRARVIVTVAVAVLLAVILFFLSQRYAHPVCRAPNVPIQELDARLTDIGCATIGPYRQFHGAWVDAMDSSWFHINSDAAPDADKLDRTDAWLFVSPRERAALYAQIPEVTGGERVRDQVVLVSFEGTEYRIDQPNRYGLRRFYDIGTIRAVRLLRRDFISNRVQ